jgi:hypothetical protein
MDTLCVCDDDDDDDDDMQINNSCLIMSRQVMNLLQQLYLLHNFV